MHEERSAHVAYRAVLLAAGLLLFGLLFRQLVTLLLAILITVIVSIPLAAAATRLQRRGVPRPIGALAALLGGVLAVSLLIYLLIPPFVDQSDEFVEDVPRIVDDLEGVYADVTGEDPGQVGDRVQEFVEQLDRGPRAPDRADHLDRAQPGRRARRARAHPDHRLLHGGAARAADRTGSSACSRRGAATHVRHVMDRLRISWIGWMEGVAIDMLVTFVLLYLGLELVGSTSRSSSRCCRPCWWWCPTSARSPAPSRRCCSRSPTRPARRSWCSPSTCSCSSSRAT